MARRIVVSGLVTGGLVAAGVLAVTAMLPETSSAVPDGARGTAQATTAPPQPPSTPTSSRPSVPAARTATDSPAGGAGRLDLTKTLPPGSALPAESACAAAVRRSPREPRPENQAANSRTPPAGWVQQPFEGFARPAQARIIPRVDGRFTGTTDEILQWAACKWGFDVDTVRAQAFTESKWRMTEHGDGGTSWGIMQIKPSAHPGTWPWARDSTAYNVDYTLARRRACYEGWTYEGSRTRGDLWGCTGMWYSGTYGSGYSGYLASVRHWYATKPWRRW